MVVTSCVVDVGTILISIRGLRSAIASSTGAATLIARCAQRGQRYTRVNSHVVGVESRLKQLMTSVNTIEQVAEDSLVLARDTSFRTCDAWGEH